MYKSWNGRPEARSCILRRITWNTPYLSRIRRCSSNYRRMDESQLLTSDSVAQEEGKVEQERRKITYGDELDLEILEWLLAFRDEQLPISIHMLCIYAATLVKSKLPELAFNASRGWAQKFLRCHSQTLRMKTFPRSKASSRLGGTHCNVPSKSPAT